MSRSWPASGGKLGETIGGAVEARPPQPARNRFAETATDLGEEIIDRGGDLASALVAVPHHPGQPFRVRCAGAHDAADLVCEAADSRRLRARMIAVPDRRLAAGEVADGDRKAALELVVIVAVENVVLAIVLVVHDCLGCGEAVAEERHFGGTLGAAAIGIAAPGEIGLGEIAIALPAALVDERLQTGAVGARFRAEDAVAGAAVRRLGRHALLLERGTIGGDARGQRVDGFGLVERGDRARRRVDEIDEIGEGVAKEAGDPQGDVDAWPVEDAGGQDLEAGDAAGPRLPLRARPHQRQRLCDIVTARSHARGAPGRERATARPARPASSPAISASPQAATAGPSSRASHARTGRVAVHGFPAATPSP